MHVWLNLINNSINIGIQRGIRNPTITVDIFGEKVIVEDNCGKIDELVLHNLINEQYSGLGIKMSKTILHKYGWYLDIKNSSKGAIFYILKS